MARFLGGQVQNNQQANAEQSAGKCRTISRQMQNNQQANAKQLTGGRVEKRGD